MGEGGKGEGRGQGEIRGEGTNPDLEGLQAGCSDSVLRKGVPVNNGPGVR